MRRAVDDRVAGPGHVQPHTGGRLKGEERARAAAAVGARGRVVTEDDAVEADVRVVDVLAGFAHVQSVVDQAVAVLVTVVAGFGCAEVDAVVERRAVAHALPLAVAVEVALLVERRPGAVVVQAVAGDLGERRARLAGDRACGLERRANVLDRRSVVRVEEARDEAGLRGEVRDLHQQHVLAFVEREVLDHDLVGVGAVAGVALVDERAVQVDARGVVHAEREVDEAVTRAVHVGRHVDVRERDVRAGRAGWRMWKLSRSTPQPPLQAPLTPVGRCAGTVAGRGRPARRRGPRRRAPSRDRSWPRAAQSTASR